MQLTHSFTVPGSVEETWRQFQDIADIAQCFPGAQVTAAEGDTFEGTVKVKLGPIALVYAGSGTFTEKDETLHRFVVEAKGRDKRGNGTAAANVTLTMAAAGQSTDVQIDTDLTITGKPAQFGRGVMQDVSDKLLGQFVSCLEQRSSADGPAAAASDPEPTAVSDPGSAAPSAAEPSPASAAEPSPASAAQPSPAPTADNASRDDAIDLGTTVLPAIARAYWKQAVAGVLGLALVVAVLRRLLR